MPKMTGSKLFAEMMRGYGITHVFFVPTILMKALAEMESLGDKRIMTHGEKAAAGRACASRSRLARQIFAPVSRMRSWRARPCWLSPVVPQLRRVTATPTRNWRIFPSSIP